MLTLAAALFTLVTLAPVACGSPDDSKACQDCKTECFGGSRPMDCGITCCQVCGGGFC